MGKYRVTIEYREPTWDAHNGRPDRPRDGTFEVSAPNALHALAEALTEFRRIEALSWVGWIREVSRASVETIEDGGDS